MGRAAVARRPDTREATPLTVVPDPPAERTIIVSVELTITEAEALEYGAFTCTSPDPRRHHAGRRALLALRDAIRRSPDL